MHFKSGDSISVLKAGIQMWISKCSVLHAWHHHPSLSTPNCSMTLMISFVTVCHRMPLPHVLVIQWFYICPFIFLFLCTCSTMASPSRHNPVFFCWEVPDYLNQHFLHYSLYFHNTLHKYRLQNSVWKGLILRSSRGFTEGQTLQRNHPQSHFPTVFIKIL